MCYLIAKRFNELGSIALKTVRGKEPAHFVDKFQEKIGYDIQLIIITRPSAYGEYELYHFLNSYEEFEKKSRFDVILRWKIDLENIEIEPYSKGDNINL